LYCVLFFLDWLVGLEVSVLFPFASFLTKKKKNCFVCEYELNVTIIEKKKKHREAPRRRIKCVS
jgi:hypothetical protein